MTPADFQHRLDEARQLLLGQHFAQALLFVDFVTFCKSPLCRF